MIFPQQRQPGAAESAAGAADGSIVLSNDLISATFINDNGRLSFGGSPELGLLAGTELFSITLGDDTEVKSSEMTVTGWSVADLDVDANAAVASQRYPGKVLTASLTYGDMAFEWRAVLRDGSRANVYGWASWNGRKATLALRNPAASARTFEFTMREVLEIPDYVTSPIYLRPSFAVQGELDGVEMNTAIDLDKRISVTLPASSVFVFDGSHEKYSGIDGVAAGIPEAADGRVFDLMGHQCDEADLLPGIYIKDHKKFLVR